jgi:hypothetical protein
MNSSEEGEGGFKSGSASDRCANRVLFGAALLHHASRIELLAHHACHLAKSGHGRCREGHAVALLGNV